MLARTLAVGLLALSLASAARAQNDRDEARAHNEVAKIKFRKADYRGALDEYHKAYTLAPIPELLYNIGRCHEELGDRRAAIEAYRRYLAAKPDAEERAELQAHIADLDRAAAQPAPVEPPAPNVDLAAPAPADRPPIYRRIWFWAAVAAVVVIGAAVGITAGVVAGSGAPALGFPATVLR